MQKQIILLVSANPQDGTQINVIKELREIYNKFELNFDQNKQFEVKQLVASSYDDLSKALHFIKPSIIHFACHGIGEQGLILVNDQQHKEIIDTDTLIDLFKIAQGENRNINCVIFNACYGKFQAEKLSEYVKYTIGMNEKIKDNYAIIFAKTFYEFLVGDNIKIAFQYAKNKIRQEYTKTLRISGQNSESRAEYDPAPDDIVSLPIPDYEMPMLIVNEKLADIFLDDANNNLVTANQDEQIEIIISYEQQNSLDNILSTINLEKLKLIAEKTLKNQGYNDFKIEIENVKNLMDLKNLLLKKFPFHKEYKDEKNKEFATIFEFAKQILETDVKDLKTEPTQEDEKQWLQKQEEVKQWLENTAKKQNLIFLSEPIKPPITSSKKIINSHLLISLIPNTGLNDTFTLKTELVDFLDNQSIERNLVESKVEGINNIKNLSYLTIEPYILELINHQEIKKRKNSNFIIEMFVLYNYFNVDFGLCKIPHRALKKSPPQPLSSQYPLVLRSLERCKNKDNLDSKWQELNKITKLSELIKEVEENNQNRLIKYFNFKNKNYNWEDLYTDWEQETKLLSVVITDQIPSEKEEEFFDVYDASGVPISLWSRQSNVICDFNDETINIQEKFKQILMKMESLQDLSSIFKEIHRLREYAHNKKAEAQKYLGYHLGFICDNPQLIPDPKSDVYFQLL